jgi:hypothetical protein
MHGREAKKAVAIFEVFPENVGKKASTQAVAGRKALSLF